MLAIIGVGRGTSESFIRFLGFVGEHYESIGDLELLLFDEERSEGFFLLGLRVIQEADILTVEPAKDLINLIIQGIQIQPERLDSANIFSSILHLYHFIDDIDNRATDGVSERSNLAAQTVSKLLVLQS